MLALLFIQDVDAAWKVVNANQNLWTECVVKAAETLEPSREPAQDIADAAMSQCLKFELQTRNAASDLLRNYYPLVPNSSLDKELATTRTIVRNAAINEVVTVRARRKP